MSESLGDRLRRFRKQAGLSQGELAVQAKTSKTYVSELETGESDRPSAAKLLDLADALGVTIADLLGKDLGPTTSEIPESLRQFANENGIPEADVVMMASVRYRGNAPKTVKRWEHIYNAIRLSEGIDAEEKDEQAD